MEGRRAPLAWWGRKAKVADGQLFLGLLAFHTLDGAFNPNGSVWAIEGITSADGRIIGKMGHSERVTPNAYRNVPGNTDSRLFEGGVAWFR